MINFNRSFYTENTLKYLEDVLINGHPSGDGKYTRLCHEWLEEYCDVQKALLVHSGTAALEMQAILANISVGDEVIMPSYTFVSTANAFVLRGAIPVFVDIRPDTLNINEKLIEDAITPKTKAIVPVHYAGVSCEMDTILDIAKRHNLLVIEDAAQGMGATYKGKALGSIGDLGAVSFHETKNIMSGEGGALFINNSKFNELAEIIREKGTNRSKFFRGQVDKYTWVNVGSSYLPSDLIAAYLYSTLDMISPVIEKRLELWNTYHQAFEKYEISGILRRPIVPESCQHNGHIYYLLLDDIELRTEFISYLKEQGILSVFHYIPLHSAPAGVVYGRSHGDMSVTNKVSDTLVRLPLYFTLSSEEQQKIIQAVHTFFDNRL